MDKYEIFDSVVNATLINIYSLSKSSKEISLSNLDLSKKSHRYFLREAFVAAALYNKTVTVDKNWIQRKIMLKKIGIKKQNFKRTTQFLYEINVPEVLDFMKVLLQNYSYDDIYDSYLGRKK